MAGELTYNDISSTKMLNKAGLLELSGQIKGYINTNMPQSYTLPTATTSTLGGVKVDGTTITISDGVISTTGGGSSYTNEDLLQDIFNYSDNSTYNSIGPGNTKNGILYANNDETAWQGVQSGKWFYWTWGSLNNTTISLLQSEYGITQYNIQSLDQAGSQSGPISGPYWKPYDRNYKNNLCKRNDINKTIDCYPVPHSNGEVITSLIPWASITDTSGNSQSIGKWLNDITTLKSSKLSTPTVPSNDGTYKLTSTISSGSATYSWEADSGSSGGGASYTAGNGINIDANNEISNGILVIKSSDISSAEVSMLGYGNYNLASDNSNANVAKLATILASYYNGSASVQGNKFLSLKGFIFDGIYFARTGINDGDLEIYSAIYKTKYYGQEELFEWKIALRNNSDIYLIRTQYKDSLIINNNSDVAYYPGTHILTLKSPKVPTAPSNDGTYMLKCVVSSGTPTYSWEAVS